LEIKIDNEATPAFSVDRMLERLQKAAIFSILGGSLARGQNVEYQLYISAERVLIEHDLEIQAIQLRRNGFSCLE
jgi:hypothetical protein